jgi:flagellar basal body-associated protein FliL
MQIEPINTWDLILEHGQRKSKTKTTVYIVGLIVMSLCVLFALVSGLTHKQKTRQHSKSAVKNPLIEIKQITEFDRFCLECFS